MKRLFVCAAVLALFASTAFVQAGGDCGCSGGCGGQNGQGCFCPCPPKASPDHNFLVVGFVPTTFSTTEDKLVCREIVKPVTVCESVPVWTEKQKCVTTYTKVAREIEKEVVSCHMVPECICDPCTGCMKTCYKPHTCVTKVKCCVWDCVPVQSTVTEKVCTMQKQEKTILQKCVVQEIVEEVKKEDVILVTLDAYKGKPPSVPAPVCCPAPAAPCSCGGH